MTAEEVEALKVKHKIPDEPCLRCGSTRMFVDTLQFHVEPTAGGPFAVHIPTFVRVCGGCCFMELYYAGELPEEKKP